MWQWTMRTTVQIDKNWYVKYGCKIFITLWVFQRMFSILFDAKEKKVYIKNWTFCAAYSFHMLSMIRDGLVFYYIKGSGLENCTVEFVCLPQASKAVCFSTPHILWSMIVLTMHENEDRIFLSQLIPARLWSCHETNATQKHSRKRQILLFGGIMPLILECIPWMVTSIFNCTEHFS